MCGLIQAERIFQMIDDDNSGFIDSEEFVRHFIDPTKAQTPHVDENTIDRLALCVVTAYRVLLQQIESHRPLVMDRHGQWQENKKADKNTAHPQWFRDALKEVLQIDRSDCDNLLRLARRASDGKIYHRELLEFLKRRAQALKAIPDPTGGSLLNKLRALKDQVLD